MAIIKCSDYIIKRLEKYGVKHVFMISGGGVMHLNDSFGKSKKIEYICNHHEQASAIGAEGYARTCGKMGVVCVTSGPGGTNTLTGVIGQWLDSIPVLYLSGQVKFDTTIASCPDIGLRQLGDQEINIIDIVKSVTKFATMVTDSNQIGRILDKAIFLANNGRKGPVWLDIPLNIQSAMIDEKNLIKYDKREDIVNYTSGNNLKNLVIQVIQMLNSAKRPILLIGHGVRLADAQQILIHVAEKLGIPVLTTFNGFDLIPSIHPLFIGRIGTIGTRAGNFALQNSDLLLSIGTRNNIRQVTYDWKNFARKAKKVIIDIDPTELKKPTIKPDLIINTDAGEFLKELDHQLNITRNIHNFRDWTNWCFERKMKYPVVLSEYQKEKDSVNPYYFVKTLTDCMELGAVLVAGNGTACVATFQAGIVKKGQRIFWNSGCAAMGYDLPAAIGACLANERKDVICLAGDGSLMMNIQELETVAFNNLPIKLFILNNDGYISIRQTQSNFFQGRFTACDSTCGVGFPDFMKVASSFGLPTRKLSEHKNLKKNIHAILKKNGPIVCEVKLSRDYIFNPKLTSEKRRDGTLISKSLEDMFPFLPRDEYLNNIIDD